MDSRKVHLVFSGGGVRCFSYIGAIQKLAEYDISIASISACSMGSVLGALVCSGMDVQNLETAIVNFNFKSLKTKKAFSILRYLEYPFASHTTPDYVKIITALLGKDPLLEELKTPFSALALDLRQCRFLVYSSGTHLKMKVSEVLKIATAIPLMYEPYKLDKYLLVDAAAASNSPVWMAAANPGNYPILVLKPMAAPNDDYKKSFPQFLNYLFNASTSSHDQFTFSQSARAINIEINCGAISYDDFDITREKIEGMILQGQAAMEQKLKEFNYNFNRILDLEEIIKEPTEQNAENKAAALASKMQLDYQKEILNRSQVFVSYSRKDKVWLTKLQAYLKSLERFTGIKTWDDTLISGGDQWMKEIEKALVTTKVAILLATADFFASDFIQNKEMAYLLEISNKENVKILWVAISSYPYEITPLNAIQCANDPSKPLDTLSEADQNKEMANICKTIVSFMK